MEKIKEITQKIGFWNTLEILKDEPLPLKEFFKKMNKKSYYNAFYRVKDFMLEHAIIYMVDGFIGLSVCGMLALKDLQHVNDFMQVIANEGD